MSLPLVTRFGADPLLDLEVANKRYVDNSTGGGGFWVTGSTLSQVNVNNLFSSLDIGSGFLLTETFRTTLVPSDITTWDNMSVHVALNTRDGEGRMRNRINSVTGTMLNTIPALTTGDFQDLVNTGTFSNGDLVNYIYQIDGTTGQWRPDSIASRFSP